MSHTNKMSPLHLARGKVWGNTQRQIQREKVSSWIPLGLFMWEMKSLYNTSMILTFQRRDNFWIAALSRELRWIFSSHADWEYTEPAPESIKKVCGSFLSMLSKGMEVVVYIVNIAWPQLLKPDLFSPVGIQCLTHPQPLLFCRHLFQSFAKTLIFKVKSDHRQQILMHSAPETSDILHS